MGDRNPGLKRKGDAGKKKEKRNEDTLYAKG